jgi:hypothetical protein
MTPEEAEAMRAALAAHDAEHSGGDDGPPVVVVDATPDPAEIDAAGDAEVARIEAQADAEVKVIHAATAQQVAVIEAQAEADRVDDDEDLDADGNPTPEHQHPYFRTWGKRRNKR